jgi:hypothetical protein
VSKSSRNRQQARERIESMRAQEARRRRRWLWLAGVGAIAVLAAAGVGIALALGQGGSATTSGSQPTLASLRTLGKLTPPPRPGPLGPEGVPIPHAVPLAGTATIAHGQPVDGISCENSEQTLFHIHAHLTIFVNGAPRQVPAGIGIPGAAMQDTTAGPFAGAGNCFYWLHTHSADGIIHIESPVHRTYTLGDFFDEWGLSLGPSQVGPAKGHVVVIYNGQLYAGNPRDIPLTAHAQIQLEVGTPHVGPVSISWPAGL